MQLYLYGSHSSSSSFTARLKCMSASSSPYTSTPECLLSSSLPFTSRLEPMSPSQMMQSSSVPSDSSTSSHSGILSVQCPHILPVVILQWTVVQQVFPVHSACLNVVHLRLTDLHVVVNMYFLSVFRSKLKQNNLTGSTELSVLSCLEYCW